jgi:hypothetical protein
MKVQVLNFDGCPHYSPTRQLLSYLQGRSLI